MTFDPPLSFLFLYSSNISKLNMLWKLMWQQRNESSARTRSFFLVCSGNFLELKEKVRIQWTTGNDNAVNNESWCAAEVHVTGISRGGISLEKYDFFFFDKCCCRHKWLRTNILSMLLAICTVLLFTHTFCSCFQMLFRFTNFVCL